MASKSNIEWTGHTWNPLAGCSVLSPGCTNCYAMKLAARLDRMEQPLYAGLTKQTKGGAVWTGQMRQSSEKVLTAPLRRRKPTVYFVNSMSDLFHENVQNEWIDKIFAVMALCPQHTFQVLTKRAGRMQDYFRGIGRIGCIDTAARTFGYTLSYEGIYTKSIPLSNVWLGVSTERQQEADERIPLLLQTPAAIRFISAEPLLGPINLRGLAASPNERRDCLKGELRGVIDGHTAWRKSTPPGLDWVIAGGESGHGHRGDQSHWYYALLRQCQQAGVPFFMKQMAGRKPIPDDLLVRQFPPGVGGHQQSRNP